jgi:type II secretory pathway component PulF
MKKYNKKGIMLSQAFPAVLTLVLIAVLVIISIYLFTTLNTSFNSTNDPGSAARNATAVMITQFGTFPALIGLVGTIIFLALVIGVLIGSFAYGSKKGM